MTVVVAPSYMEKIYIFTEELASKYLPIIVEIVRVNIRDHPERSLDAYTEAACLLLLCKDFSRALRRFVREHPGSKELVVDLLSNLHRSLPTPQELQKPLINLPPGVFELGSRFRLLIIPLAYAPNVFSYARVRPSTISLLEELIVALKTIPTSTPLRYQSPTLLQLASSLLDALKLRDVGPLRTFVASDFEGARPFEIRCELSATNECVDLPEGMMLCSKCKSINYCSREHQKKDWPNHKKMCFKPNW